MYQYIMVFQIICILLTGGFLYVLCESEAIKNKKYRASLIGTMIGFFLMQSGYGVFLQAVTLEGLQMGEMICRIGKILVVLFWIMTCGFLCGEWKKTAQSFLWIIALSEAAFVYFVPLRRMVRKRDSMLQNQYFYYIEGEYSWIFRLGVILLTAGLLFSIFLIGKQMKKGMPKSTGLLLIIGTLMPLIAAYIPQSISRFYDLTIPAGMLAEILLFKIVLCNLQKIE